MHYSITPTISRRRAFTLVEILGVLAIVAVLAGLTCLMFSSAQKSVDNIHKNVHAALSSHKKAKARKTPDPSAAANEFIVMFKPGTANAASQATRLAELCSGKVLYNYSGPFLGCALRIAPGTLPALTGDAVVAAVEKNAIMHACVETVPTGVRRVSSSLSIGGTINSPIHNVKQPGIVNPGGAYVPIAIVDSGIDATHPDLNVVFNIGFNQPNFGDQDGHGTHCAGIAAAIHNDIGVVGIAPGAPLWNVRVLDAQGAGLNSDIIAALQFLAANADKVGVISMSLGGGVSNALNAAVDFCVAQGQVVIVAAGNSSVDAATFSPASAASCICVAALADSDGLPGGAGPATSAGPDDTFATFSNWGTTVKVIAPGVDILSTLPGNTYGLKSGTSMACPLVAGLVVLQRSALSSPVRNVRFKTGLPVSQGRPLSPAAVLQQLLATSRENIPGIFDTRTYPLVAGRGL